MTKKKPKREIAAFRSGPDLPADQAESDCCRAPIKDDPGCWLCSKCDRICNPVPARGPKPLPADQISITA